MKEKSTNYQTIWDNPRHYAESKIVTESSTYTESQIINMETTGSLFADSFDIGNVVINSAEFTLYGIGPDEIPSMTRIEIWTRLCVGRGIDKVATDWLPMGVFYTKKPNYDTEGHLLSATAYDEMFRTEVVPFEQGATVTTWNSPTLRQVAKHLADGEDITGVIESNFGGIGIDLEDPTQVPSDVVMSSIPFNFSVREILSEIAIAACGNWTLCFKEEDGEQVAKLRLVKLSDGEDGNIDLGRNVQSFSKGDAIKPVTHVKVFYGYDENGVALYAEAVTNPDDGRTVEKTLETITDGGAAQDIANNILAGFQNVPYESFTANGGELDPAAELGDAVSVNGINSVLGAIDTNFNQGMWADIEAPGIPEEDDFGYVPANVRKQDRQEQENAVNKASIAINSQSIESEVQARADEDVELRSLITQTASGIRVTLESQAEELNAHAEQQARYLQYDASGLTLGDVQQNTKAVLTSEKLSFYDKTNNESAYVGAEGFYIKDTGYVGLQLNLGEHWAIIPASDGHLTIKWRS